MKEKYMVEQNKKQTNMSGLEQTHEYDDIIMLPHHQSTHHLQMPIRSRAAQFAPFAALTGHEEAITETARLTDAKLELDDTMKEEIDRKLQFLIEHIKEHPTLNITHFVPDCKKDGGTYEYLSGTLKKIDCQGQAIVIENVDDTHTILWDNMLSIRGDIFSALPNSE